MAIRQPIVAVLGHVDHGKTTLLDKMRGSAVAAKEAGFITQHAGASEIPADAIRKTSGKLLDQLKIKLEIPGLLMLDTPGHEAFTTIRKRGSSIADLAILVVDITEGFQPQTDEALSFLKEFKTPFVVAATKVDRVQGWKSYPGSSFKESLAKQPEHVKENVDTAVYKVVGQLSERGFESERFDRVEDFKKTVAIVPVSGTTGEGLPELLMMLAGLAQTFLRDQLKVEEGYGSGAILEIKEVRGLGVAADIILYDGEIRKGDWLVVGGREPIVTKIRSLLKPKPLKDIRVEKEFVPVDSVTAAAGVKVNAPMLEKAVAGSPIRVVRTEAEAEKAKEELASEVEAVEFTSGGDGVVLRADTLGSLEAMIKLAQDRDITIRKAEVGAPTKKDLMELETVSDPNKRVMLVFNLPVPGEVMDEARDRNIPIINGEIIYRVLEGYEKWLAEQLQKQKEAKLASIARPGKIKLLPGFVFRANDPAIVGVEVMAGSIKPGVKLHKGGKEVGWVKDLQQEGQHVDKADKGQRIAVSIQGPTVGRQIREGDELTTEITERDLKLLEELELWDEAQLAREILAAS
jgi:translation initiation factor 5B